MTWVRPRPTHLTVGMTEPTIAAPLEPDPELTYKTLRLPRGFLQDFEETVIQFDRQFLTEVGLSLGMTRAAIAPLIRQVLGTGAPQPVLALLAPPIAEEAPAFCPWWECRGDNFWRRCPRHRVSPSLPCSIHERAVPCPLTRLDSDPFFRDAPFLQPMEFENRIYWVNSGGTRCYNEDGTLSTDGVIRFQMADGELTPVFISAAALVRLS
jgi:hypothetical protein